MFFIYSTIIYYECFNGLTNKKYFEIIFVMLSDINNNINLFLCHNFKKNNIFCDCTVVKVKTDLLRFFYFQVYLSISLSIAISGIDSFPI